MKKIIKCKCGSNSFWVIEKLIWKGFLNEDGEMDCKNKDCEITKITCVECGRSHQEDKFNQINFN